MLGQPQRKFARLDEMLVHLKLCRNEQVARGFVRMGIVTVDGKVITEIHRLIPAGTLIDCNGRKDHSRFGGVPKPQPVNLKRGESAKKKISHPIILDGKPYYSQSEAERENGMARGSVTTLIKLGSNRVKKITRAEFEKIKP